MPILKIILIISVSFVIYSVAVYAILEHLKLNSNKVLNILKSIYKKRNDALAEFVKLVEPSVKKDKKSFQELKDKSLLKAESSIKSVLAQDEVSNLIDATLANLENNKSLQDDKNFKRLKNSLESMETDIYENISKYNSIANNIEVAFEEFPKSIIAKIFKIEKVEKINL